MYPSVVAALLAEDSTPIEDRRVAGKGLTVGEYATASAIEHARAHPHDAPALARAASLLSRSIIRGAERWRRASGELAAMASVDLRGEAELSWVERAERLPSQLIGEGTDRRLSGLETDANASIAARMAADATRLDGRARATTLWHAAKLLIEAWRASRDVPGAHVDAWIAMRQSARELGFVVPDHWSYDSHPEIQPDALEWS